MPESDEFAVDPFGRMQHVSFRDGIVDMEGPRQWQRPIEPTFRQAPAGRQDFRRMIVATVPLPPGRLTALAPLANSARSLLGWTIGNQTMDSLAEMAMSCLLIQTPDKIELAPGLVVKGENDFVTWRRNRDVTVWITNSYVVAPERRALNSSMLNTSSITMICLPQIRSHRDFGPPRRARDHPAHYRS